MFKFKLKTISLKHVDKKLFLAMFKLALEKTGFHCLKT